MRSMVWLGLSCCVLACDRGVTTRSPIAVEQVGTVSGPAGDGGFPSYTLISPRLAGGRRIAFQPNSPAGPPLVVDSLGHVIDTLATVGEGPGQVRQVSKVTRGIDDSVFVVDMDRVFLFSPDLHFVRSFPTSVHSAWGATVIKSGDLVLASATYGVDEPVIALHPTDGSRSWGIAAPTQLGARSSELRALARAPDGTLWTARVFDRLELEHFSAAGERIADLLPEVEWFHPYEHAQPPSRTAPPSPSVVGLWVDSLGRAWVVGWAADPKWASAEGTMERGEGGTEYFKPKRGSDVRDGIIDVIDLATGRSIASFRSDTGFGQVVEPWMISRPRINDDGWQQEDLFKVSWRSASH